MTVWAEMAFLQAQGDEQKHQHTHEHVKAVKTCQHEEGGAVDAGAELEVVLGVRMVVLITLHAKEGNAQQNRQPHEAHSFATVAIDQRVVRNG